MDLLERITTQRPTLSKAEAKVADMVLSQPNQLVNATLAKAAALAEVSEPTIIRFTRTLGCEGYQDFKVRLAQSIVLSTSNAYSGVSADDSVAVYAHKILSGSIDTLLQLRHSLDLQAIEHAVSALAKAHKVDIYGFAASGAVAVDAAHKLLHLRTNATAYTDAHLQVMSAATLSPADVVLAVSHTGKTKELLESVQLAKQRGASIIGITAHNSPLAALCTFCIAVDSAEDTNIYPPARSRIAHLLVIDVLTVGLALALGHHAETRMQHIKQALRAKRCE